MPCTNTVANHPLCCDGIYLPSFVFRNVAGFPQERIQYYTITVGDWGGVMWEIRVHADYYQVRPKTAAGSVA